MNEEFKKTYMLIKKANKIEKLLAKQDKKALKKERNRIRNEAPHLRTLEEIGNAITHGIGALLSLGGLVLMLTHSNTTLKIIAACVYGISLFLMMLMSCLYHSFKWGTKVKRIWRRFDYSSIYLLIGGTYAPLLLIDLGNTLGIVWFIVMWVAIITGITMVAIFGPGRLKWLHFPLYFIIGWSGIVLLPRWIDNNIALILWILGGGLAYTFGMIPFTKKNVKNSHFIWHFFVLIGAITHWLGIYLTIFVK